MRATLVAIDRNSWSRSVGMNGRDHRNAHSPWQMSITEGEEMLRTKRLSSLQRQIIADDNERKRQLIAPLLEGSPR